MRTAHLTTLTTTFSPFSACARVPRLLLTLLPANAHHRIRITQKVLPRLPAGQPAPSASLELGFKDGKVLTYRWEEGDLRKRRRGEVEGGKKVQKAVKVADIVEEVDRHERMLERREELSG